jgi:Rieske Fe-S protein
MKPVHSLSLSLAALLAFPTLARAQDIRVNLHATGADGDITVDSGTVEHPLPESGVIQANSVTVAAGATLVFTRNARNTGVVILSRGDVVIDGTLSVSGSDGTVGVAGQGGPGGMNGGAPTVNASDRGYLPRSPNWLGASNPPWVTGANGGNGSKPPTSTVCTNAGSGGGGGGGGIWVMSETAIRGSATGSVLALGGLAATRLPTGGGCGPSGSGEQARPGDSGTIRLMAPTLDAGSVTLRADSVQLMRLFTTGDPSATKRDGSLVPVTVSEVLQKLPSFTPNVTIASVDGQTLGGLETDVITVSNGDLKHVVILVEGCGGADGSAHLSMPVISSSANGGMSLYTSSKTFTQASDPLELTFDFRITGPVSGRIETYVSCR